MGGEGRGGEGRGGEGRGGEGRGGEGRGGEGREGKGREGKGREGKGREGKGREGREGGREGGRQAGCKQLGPYNSSLAVFSSRSRGLRLTLQIVSSTPCLPPLPRRHLVLPRVMATLHQVTFTALWLLSKFHT